MTTAERRVIGLPDRRSVPRGGRRTYDRPGRHPVLLVADAYEGARQSSARYLDQFGFHVEQATSGVEASAILDRVRPHLILSDAALPDSSVLTARLSADPMAATPVIVLMTWESTPLFPHAAGVLMKPYRLRVMLDEVRRVLRAKLPAS